MSSDLQKHDGEYTPEPAHAVLPARTGQGYSSAPGSDGLGPEWAMVGVDVPAGKRLYASRKLKGTEFSLAVDAHLNGEGWALHTILQNALIITKATYGECLADLMRIWENWDRNERAEAELERGGRRAIGAGQDGGR